MASMPPSARPARQVDLEEQRRKHHQHHGGCNLRGAQAEYQTLHGAQACETELEADAEHQEHHAECGQLARLRHIGNPADGMRPDRDAHKEVTEHRRQAQDAAHHHHPDCDGQQNED